MNERFVGLWLFVKFFLSVLCVVVFGFLIQYFLSPLRGDLVVYRVPPNGERAIERIHIRNGVTEVIPTTSEAKEYVAFSPIQNSEARAIQGNDGVQISFLRGERKQFATHDASEIDWLRFSPDGGSIAFASLATTTGRSRTPEDYAVIRMLPTGESVVVGTGIRPFPVPGNATIAITSNGVVSLVPGVNDPRLLIKTEVPATGGTPLAVSLNGDRIAWVNPMDNSLQVFSRTPAGTFVPLLLNEHIAPTSLAFSPDGNRLAFAEEEGNGNSSISVLTLLSGAVTPVGQFEGIIDISQWIYE